MAEAGGWHFRAALVGPEGERDDRIEVAPVSSERSWAVLASEARVGGLAVLAEVSASRRGHARRVGEALCW